MKYILSRLMALLAALVVSSLAIFIAINWVPGSASTAALGLNPTEEARRAFEQRYGLDRPLPVQYLSWLGGVVQGDFGRSYQNDVDIASELRRRLPVTLELTVLAALIAVAISMPLAILAAKHQGTMVDLGASLLALIGASIPSFVLATFLILFISLRLKWLPPGGYVPFWEDPAANLRLMAMPAISLGLVSAALLMRIFRASLVDVLGTNYTRTARAKGATEARVFRVHAFRNASIPLITVGALEIGVIFGGAVIIEKIFQLPGIGSYVLRGIETRDFGVLQAGALTITLFVLLANLAVDLLAAWIDPRLRYTGR